jgi:DNA-binding LacI/PurR family transcriptional regulator
VEFSRELLGQEIVRLLEAQAADRRRRPERVRLAAQLVIRKSCAAAKVAAGV